MGAPRSAGRYAGMNRPTRTNKPSLSAGFCCHCTQCSREKNSVSTGAQLRSSLACRTEDREVRRCRARRSSCTSRRRRSRTASGTAPDRGSACRPSRNHQPRADRRRARASSVAAACCRRIPAIGPPLRDGLGGVEAVLGEQPIPRWREVTARAGLILDELELRIGARDFCTRCEDHETENEAAHQLPWGILERSRPTAPSRIQSASVVMSERDIT